MQKIKTIYDKSSVDPNINWGYTSGIQGGTKVVNKNFANYKCLIIYCNTFVIQCRADILLTPTIYDPNRYDGGAINVRIDNGVDYRTYFEIEIADNKTSFNVNVIQNAISKNHSSDFCVFKIEGVI